MYINILSEWNNALWVLLDGKWVHEFENIASNMFDIMDQSNHGSYKRFKSYQ